LHHTWYPRRGNAITTRRSELKRLSRVLCAVDIDERSNQVFEHALTLARSHDAKLLILHAASPLVAYNRGGTQRVELLRRLRSRAEAAGVDVRVTVQQGPADEIILLHASARNVDLIVIGTSRKERRRGLSGWIAERVLRDASCPTLVVPADASAPTAFTDSVLCAVDFSSASPGVVAEALRLSDDGSRRVTLLHVAHRRDAAAPAKLQSLIPAPKHGVVLTQVVVGRPVDELVRAARATNAQLLVIGAGRRSALGSRLFGKTAQLLRDATCPVLAVPADAAAGAANEQVRPLAA
jgi:nucleotide-binding universal stress UspA family protein